MGCCASHCNCFRHMVSKKKKRYIKDGFDLDLTYVKENIIVMGFPSQNCGAGQSCIEAGFRNPMSQTKAFLEEKHPDHYRVFNFCAERCYDPKNFQDRVGRYAFLDHNCPSLKMVHSFCLDAAAWLKDSQNIVALHCKAGKGRAGLMCVCLLVHLGLFDVEGAHQFYATQRTHNAQGVTIPSQRRYTQYYATLLQRWKAANGGSPRKAPVPFHVQVPRLKMTRIHFSSLSPGIGMEPAFTTECFSGDNYDTPKVRWSYQDELARLGRKLPKFPPGEVELDAMDNNELFGDVRVTVYNQRKKIFTLWFNTGFVHPPEADGRQRLTFTKSEIDKAWNDKKCKMFPSDFTVICEFESSAGAEPEPHKEFEPGQRQGTPPGRPRKAPQLHPPPEENAALLRTSIAI